MEKSAFLNRISQRLGRALPNSPPERPVVNVPTAVSDRDPKALLARFQQEIEKVGASVEIVPTIEGANQALRKTISDLNAEKIVTWQRSRFENWQIGWVWDEIHAIDNGPDFRTDCLAAQIGITCVDFAIAETGTLVLVATPDTPRSVSLTPTTHIALVDSRQIVATAEDAFASLPKSAQMPSSINLITGPSRSADIENDLSIGVHGPAALHVIVLSVGQAARLSS